MLKKRKSGGKWLRSYKKKKKNKKYKGGGGFLK